MRCKTPPRPSPAIFIINPRVTDIPDKRHSSLVDARSIAPRQTHARGRVAGDGSTPSTAAAAAAAATERSGVVSVVSIRACTAWRRIRGASCAGGGRGATVRVAAVHCNDACTARVRRDRRGGRELRVGGARAAAAAAGDERRLPRAGSAFDDEHRRHVGEHIAHG